MRVNLLSLCGAAAGLLFSSSLYAGTLSGALIYKDKADNIVTRSGEIEFDDANAEKLRLAIKEHEDILAEKVKVVKIETEHRTIVLAAFKNIGDMPEGTTLIVKGTLLDGNNGKVMYGDVFTRKCEETSQQQTMAEEDHGTVLERMAAGQAERKGCEISYRGGMLLSVVKADEPAPVVEQPAEQQEGASQQAN